jgi:hypothetical protein
MCSSVAYELLDAFYSYLSIVNLAEPPKMNGDFLVKGCSDIFNSISIIYGDYFPK